MTVTDTAEIEVVCPGMLDVLSVGKGHLTITIGGTKPEIDKGRKIIEEMLTKGYTIFVETDKGLTRVKKFIPERMTYVITEMADPPKRGGKSTKDVEVPVAGSKATAVGKTAGG